MDEKIESLIPPFHGTFPSIAIFGAPGVGKGTLSKFLITAGTLFHLSSGDVFRGLLPDSPAGKLFQSYAGKGLLVPDEATVAICCNYINGLIGTNRYSPAQQYLLLDGLPRTANQVSIFSKYMDVRALIVLDVPDQQVLIKRLQKRALIEGRQDDADEAVLRKRMDVYEAQTKQVVGCYPEHLVYRFNADQRPLEVARDVLIKLSGILANPPS
jgi:adenylate kinase